MERTSDRGAPGDLAVLLALAAARLAVHLLVNHRYGFHRDELALLDDAGRLAWGYVAYPPLTAAVGRLSLELFGLSLVGVRLGPALAQSAVLVLAGATAREMGGSRRAQVVAAIATACSPIGLLSGAMIQYVAFDYLAWVAIAYLVARLARRDDPGGWPAIGIAIGLGMLTKYTVVFLVAGVVAGVLATPLRRHLRDARLWVGVALSLAIFAPHLVWQWRHGFVTLEFLESIHARDVRIGRTDGFLVEQLFVSASLVTVPLWVAGLARLWRGRPDPRFRALAWMYVVPLALLVAARGRSYYLAPAYPMLLAAGAVAIERFAERRTARARRWVRGAVAAALAVAAVSGAVLMLPIAPIGSAGWRASSAAHDNFREQVGWDDLVETLGRIHDALPPEERTRAAVLAGNYGEAGAVNLLGRERGLPRAISGINSYHAIGPGDPLPEVVIVVGYERETVERMFETCDLAGRNGNRFGVENEESRFHPDLFVCRTPRLPWPELWPHLRSFG